MTSSTSYGRRWRTCGLSWRTRLTGAGSATDEGQGGSGRRSRSWSRCVQVLCLSACTALSRCQRLTFVRFAQDNATLRSQLSAQLTMLSTRNDEKNELQAEVEDLKAELDAVEGELEAERRERQRSRGMGVDGGDREELEKVRLSLWNTPRARPLARGQAGAPIVRAVLTEPLTRTRTRRNSTRTATAPRPSRWNSKTCAPLSTQRSARSRSCLRNSTSGNRCTRRSSGRLPTSGEMRWRMQERGNGRRDRCVRRLLSTLATSCSPRPSAQALVEKDADVEELADKVEALVRKVAEKDAELQAEQDETAALTHDLKKVRGPLPSTEVLVLTLLPPSARRANLPARGRGRREGQRG